MKIYHSLFLLLICSPVLAVDFSGNIALEGNFFPNEPLQADQSQHNLSLSLQPEWHHSWNNGRDAFNFVPFFRWDNQDKERTHLDIRELDILSVINEWEIQAGISKVFWGVTESQHLVDIINQTDQVESINGEDKLGQPLVRLTRLLDEGSIDLFIMPYFRERSFPGKSGRLRFALPVDTNQTTYEASNNQKHLDFAIRLNQSYDQIDWGIYWFQGTSRIPDLNIALIGGNPVLTPHYPLIKQVGLDLQYTGDEWLWKLEALHRRSRINKYTAISGGFEYSFYSILDSATDLGLITEYHHDSRGQQATTTFQNDLFLGARIALNDIQSTEFLAGTLIDLNGLARSLRIEASRRIGDNMKINLELQWFQHNETTDPAYPLRSDDNLQLELQWYF